MCSLPALRPASLQRGLVVLFSCVALCLHVHAQTDGAQKWKYPTVGASIIPGNILASPSVALDGTVYIACEVGASTAANPSGRLFALTPSGTQKWVYTTTEWIDSSPVVAADGTIYFGCWDGKLYALKPDGTPKWAPRDLGAYISASPALGADGTIYVGTGSGNLYAINPTDGSTKWFYPTLYWIEAAPAVGADGTIYIGSDDNNFYAINPNGTLKWQYTAGNDIASSAAIAADGTLYVGSRDLKLYAFTPSGSVKWTFTNSDMIDASPVLGNDGTVYVATVGGRLFALNPANGTTKWQFPAAGQPALSSLYSTPAVRADGSIILGTSDNAVYALNSDGTQRWKTTVGDWTDSSPVIAPDGTIYIGCTDKNLYALTGTVTQTLTDWPQFLRTPQRNAFQPLGSVAGTTGRLANLSVRTLAGSGDNVLTVGLAITGSNSRNLLVRGIGPSLTQFGVSGVLNDPFMKIIPLNTPSPTATNNNWQDVNGGADISAAGTSVGAFSLPNGSLDSAILASFAPDYQHPPTIQISGNDGGTGIALVELYDTGGNDSARLGNISARSFVNTGDGVLIAGFVVKDNPRSLLIRAVGPRLTDFGLNGVLQKPQLRLYSAYNGISTPWADNVGWSNASNATSIGTVSGNVGAFSLNSGSQDCSMLVTLPPGNYTAQVSGANSTTGIALVEVYEVP